MKSATVLTGLLASAALAQPHGHGRVHQHRKRDDVVTDWTTVWETETVIEYIDVTTTTWFTPGVPVPTSTSSTSSETPAQFFEGASSSKASTPAPAPAPAPLTTQAAPPPPSTTSTTSTTSVYTPPPVQQPTTSAQAPAATSGSGSSGGSDAMVGDLTYYTIGVGACGEDDTGKDMTDPIVALSYLLMGSESNDNPYCGRQITISYGGKQTTAIVKDKCMGCGKYSIDVSEIVFIDVLGDLSIGREQVQWWFS